MGSVKEFTLDARMKPIDFNNVGSELPSTHSWPSSIIEDYPSQSISVPVIDLADPDLDLLRSACEEWGAFHIINHGVPEKILQEFKMEVTQLFSLPTDVKHRSLKSGIYDTTGYGTVGSARHSPSSLWHEGFNFDSYNDLLNHATKLSPPHGNLKFCQVIESYKEVMQTLAEKQLMLMLASLGITPDDIDWAVAKSNEEPFDLHVAHFQLNSYPPCPDPTRAMGFRAHTDTFLITLLNLVNDLSGLQVLHKDKWIGVDPVPGALVVICGDLIHFLTNGRFNAPMHRVIPLEGKHRYSAGLFYGPPDDAPLAPLLKLVEPGHLPLFRPIIWKEYAKRKFEAGAVVPDYVRMDVVSNNKNVDGA